MSRSILTLVLAVGCLVTVTGVATATPVTGTVSVPNGTATGDRVTVTPLSRNFDQAGQSVTTAVENGSYRATGVADAPVYAVRLQHGDANHYAVVRNATADFRLSAELTARLVRPDGSPVANATLTALSPTGPTVAQVTSGPDGRLALGPLEPNRTYQLQGYVDGAPYRFALRIGENATGARLTVRKPTADERVLTATGGNPASHVIQPIRNGSETRVVETVRLENGGERPFVGEIHFGLPDTATVRSVAFEGQQLQYRRTDEGLAVNASLAAGSPVHATIRYTLGDGRLDQSVVHETDSLAVVLQRYEPTRVDHSANLRLRNASRMPVPMLINEKPLSAGTRIQVTLPGADGQSGSSGSMVRFPAGVFAAGLLAVVGGGIVAYRTI